MRGPFKKWYSVKDRGIIGRGGGTEDVKEVVILGRTLKCTEMGLEDTGDGKHRDAIMGAVGAGVGVQVVGMPGFEGG